MKMDRLLRAVFEISRFAPGSLFHLHRSAPPATYASVKRRAA